MKDISFTPLLAIMGPTGVGKSKVSIEVAERINAEIISVDSRQVYRYLDIGTAKVKSNEREQIPHHLIDIADPDQDYNAGMFARDAERIIEEINDRGKVPLLCGGTGLYFRSLLEGFFNEDSLALGLDEFSSQDEYWEKRKSVRIEFNNRLKERGVEELYQQLRKVDPESADKIKPQDSQRIIRALEIYELAGKPISYWQCAQQEQSKFRSLKICLNQPRDVLYTKIDSRVDAMIGEGLVDEVKEVLRKGFPPELNSLQTVGYKEIIYYLNGETDLQEAIRLMKRNSRRYAKRQLTWFRKESNLLWLDVDGDVADKVVKMWETFISQVKTTKRGSKV